MKTVCIVTLLCVGIIWTVPLSAQQSDVEISIVSGEVVAGQQFVIDVEGLFPDGCGADGSVIRSQVDSTADTPVLTLDVARSSDIVCGAAVTFDTALFGPFFVELGAGEVFDISLRVGTEGADLDEFLELARVNDVTVVAQAQPVSDQELIRPGTYWDPDFPGHGVTVERQGERTFATIYSYVDTNGRPVWHTVQGELVNGTLDAEVMEFANGKCLVCGELDGFNQAVQGSVVNSAFLQSMGSAAATLAIDESPSRALRLIPFSQKLVRSEGTIAGVTFVMPDLAGDWVFVALTDAGQAESTASFVTFDFVSSGISDSGLAVFADVESSFRIECHDPNPGSGRFACDLLLDDAEIGSTSHVHVGPNHMLFNNYAAWRMN